MRQMADTPLAVLTFSVRASHVLKGMGIGTVEQLLATPSKRIAVQKNAGRKTLEEIERIRQDILSGKIDLAALEQKGRAPGAVPRQFSQDQLSELSRHSIGELGLSARPYHALIHRELVTLDQVAVLTVEEMEKWTGFGHKSLVELQTVLGQWLAKNLVPAAAAEEELPGEGEISEACRSYFQNLAQNLRPLQWVSWHQLKEAADKAGLTEALVYYGDQLPRQLQMDLLSMPVLAPALRKLFFQLAPEGILKTEELKKELDQLDLPIAGDVLFQVFLRRHVGALLGNACYFPRPNLSRYLRRHAKEWDARVLSMLRLRLQGETLQAIGNRFSVSRERVRQITSKMARKFPPLYEDYYERPFTYFKFTKEEFCQAFPQCGGQGYEFLALRWERGTHKVNRENIEAYQDVFRGQLVRCLVAKDKQSITRTALAYRVLLSNSENALTMEELAQAYNRYLKDNGYPKERLHLNIHTLTNTLRNSSHVVWDQNSRVRYCEADGERLWEEIDFQRYKDKVISTELIYRDYPDLMEALDLRDGYELFYALKTSQPQAAPGGLSVVFRRVPVVVIGDGREDQQALDLLKELSPVSYHDFYQAYEERYGVKKETAQGNGELNRPLLPYYAHGEYTLEVPTLDPRDREPFLHALGQKKFWFWDDLKRVFAAVCIHSSPDALNRAAFQRIGYAFQTGYAYKSEYGTALRFFDQEIFNGKVVQLSQLDPRLTSLPTFQSALNHKRNKLEYIETRPKVLEPAAQVERKYGISRQEIKAFQKWVNSQCREPYFNGYSLWSQIRDYPLVRKIQGKKWLYTALLRQQAGVSSLVVTGGLVPSRENQTLNLRKICLWLADRYGKKSLEEMTRLFNKQFGTQVPSYKLAEKLRGKGVWEQVITDSLESYLDQLLPE